MIVANAVAAVYDRRIPRLAAEKSGRYSRTASALFAGIQPRRLFGSAA